jgi:gliding motility-associated-like protein
MNVQLNAIASNGCSSVGVTKNIEVAYIFIQAPNDTTVLPNLPFQVKVAFGGTATGVPSFLWTPSTGLSNPVSWVPTVTISDDITYIVKGTTPQGCVALDTVNIKVFKGSAVYVPTGFTPNDDGRNDLLRGLYIGIKKVYYFKVYNRWGQEIFSTTSLIEGWDGTIRGVKQPTGTYVWMLKAEDLAGKIYEMKGISTLIR